VNRELRCAANCGALRRNDLPESGKA
jgi:hypothetical protein